MVRWNVWLRKNARVHLHVGFFVSRGKRFVQAFLFSLHQQYSNLHLACGIQGRGVSVLGVTYLTSLTNSKSSTWFFTIQSLQIPGSHVCSSENYNNSRHLKSCAYVIFVFVNIIYVVVRCCFWWVFIRGNGNIVTPDASCGSRWFCKIRTSIII